jgi:hypothetical protein
MAALYRPDVVVTRTAAANRTDEIDRINTALAAEGLGRPLGAATSAVVPTTTDPAAVRSAVRRLRARGADVPEVDLDYIYAPGTALAPARGGSYDFYQAAGCRTGHSAAPWLPAPDYCMPAAQPWGTPTAGGVRRPTVALLDTVIDDHSWLPAQDSPDPFVEVADWKPTEPLPEVEGRYAGHGTFNAGLIRLGAPAARVLSLPVMSNDGRVDESRLLEALTWLAEGLVTVDVVCLPFGRPRHDDDDAMDDIRTALLRLRTMRIVASAGNGGVDEATYPAAFATDPELSVISVGSCESPTERAAYSNHGVWVRQWRGGSNMVSCLRSKNGDGFAWWNGTSFAAVRYAAELLNQPDDFVI